MRKESEDFVEWMNKMSEQLDEKIAQEMFSSMANIFTTTAVNKEFKKGDVVFVGDIETTRSTAPESESKIVTIEETIERLNFLEKENLQLRRDRDNTQRLKDQYYREVLSLRSQISDLETNSRVFQNMIKRLQNKIKEFQSNDLKDFSRNQSKVISMVIESLRYSGRTEGEINNILSILSKGK